MDNSGYFKIIDSAPSPCIWGSLFKDNKSEKYNLKVLGINKIARNFFNIDCELAIGKDIFDLFGFNNKNTEDLNLDRIISEDKYSIDFYIPHINSFSTLDIIKVSNKVIVVWFSSDQARSFYFDNQTISRGDIDSISKLACINNELFESLSCPNKNNKDNLIGVKDCSMLQAIGDNIPDQIFFKDINGVFIYCNDSFANSLQKSKSEIIGKREYELKDNDLANKFNLQDMKVMKSKTKIVSEHCYLSINNTEICLETIKVPFLDKFGEVKGVLGIARDISLRKQSEKELERLRMEFFANLSHEFRTPINLILSSLQVFDKKLIDLSTNIDCLKCYHNISYKYLNIMRVNSFRLLKLVNNLIDLTRIDVGGMEYNPVNRDIISFVESIFESVIDFANQNGIKMIFDTTIEEKIISFDLDKMERIILNLLSNSIKYNKKNGTIYLSVSCDENFVILKVKDTGIGIPSNKLSEVFEKFKQVNDRFTKISEGSGIGLSLVKSLVELHNGLIDVESILNEYTVFTIKLPLTTNYVERNDINTTSYKKPNIELEFSDIYT